ncbi:tyrosine-type recombinase/integrase [Pseudoxanthomonas sp. USHLN014]|uniref:tyrosine-type recombinase/integrase n=1 Tax=Pseudoxanthomonas sp. USHLN014 TaxID=3081297 RepID=UPI00301D2FCA
MRGATQLPVFLSNAIDEYLLVRQARGLAANSLIAYRGDLNQFCTFAAGHDITVVQLLGERLVNRWLDAGLLHLNWSRRTAARKLEAVRGLAAWCKQERYLQHDPCADVRIRYRPRRVVAPEMEPLLQLVSGIGTDTPLDLRDRAALLLMLDPALRAGEVALLDIQQPGEPVPPYWVDVKHLRVYAHAKGGEQGEAEVVGMEEQTADAVRAWLKVRERLAAPGEHALFVNQRGRRLSRQGLYLLVRDRGAAAGIPRLHPHKLRHRRIGDITERLGLQVASAQARHRNTSTTANIYGAHAAEVQRDAVRRLAPLGEVRSC